MRNWYQYVSGPLAARVKGAWVDDLGNRKWLYYHIRGLKPHSYCLSLKGNVLQIGVLISRKEEFLVYETMEVDLTFKHHYQIFKHDATNGVLAIQVVRKSNVDQDPDNVHYLHDYFRDELNSDVG